MCHKRVKILRFVTSWVLSISVCTKTSFRPGLHRGLQDSAGGAYDGPQTSQSAGKGDKFPSYSLTSLDLTSQRLWRLCGGAENAGVEKAGVDSRVGKCRSGKCRSDDLWKACQNRKL